MNVFKKIILLTVLAGFSLASSAQNQLKLGTSKNNTGTNTLTVLPAAVLQLDSDTKGFLPPRMTKALMLAIPATVEGLEIYCTDCVPKGPYFYDGSTWTTTVAAQSTATVTNNCDAPNGFNGPFVASTTLSGSSFMVTMTNNSFSSASTTFTALDLTLGGISGITVSGVSPSGVQTITSGTSLLVTYTLTGNLPAGGTLTGDWSKLGLKCSKSQLIGGLSSAIDNTYCNTAVLNGGYYLNIALNSTNTFTVSIHNASGSAINNLPAPAASDLNVTGSGTFTVSSPSPAGKYNLAINETKTFTYTINGTPTAATDITAKWNYAGLTECTKTHTVSAVAPPPTNPTGTGSFAGKTCFDIAISNDNANSCGSLVSRASQKADFTATTTNTQTYTFTPSGTVSNVRFSYTNTSGSPIQAIVGGNAGNNITTAQTATVNYNTNLNSAALGLTSSNALTGDIYVVYNTGATNNGTDVQLKLTASVKDCACCGAYIAAGVYKTFMCHNLGADTSLDPNVPVQGIFGNFYQWGRATVVANASTPPGAIAGWNSSSAVNNSWLDSSGHKVVGNDPCPPGYRVPTSAEWMGVIGNNTISYSGNAWTDAAGSYGEAYFGPNISTHLLGLPSAGCRLSYDGTLFSRGSYGYYWSSTENSTYAYGLFFANGSVYTSLYNRTNGFSVRCVSE